MSWLYTMVFAGLVFSSQVTNTVSTAGRSVQNVPVTAEYAKSDETEKFEQTYPLSANGRVSVCNVNGSITVEAWDRNEVKLEYTKTANSKERLAEVEIRIDAKPDYFSVETEYGDWRKDKNGKGWTNNGKLTVEYRLMVPRGAVLNEIETVNGSATVSNFTNSVKVSAVNGSVNATNIRGTAKLETVNGDVTADFDQLATGNRISLETVNGRANLVIPSDANATVKADSLNGNISNDFGLPVRKGKYVGRDLYGRLGNGEVQITLESVNGDLSIKRKNDGKGASPATNLLPQKAKDDEDSDKDDDESSFHSAKMNKDVAKAVKESAKASAKAAADAQRQINKLQPEIAKIAEETARAFQSEDFEQKMKDAAIEQKAAMAKLANFSFFPSIPRVEKKSNSFPVKGTPKVTVEAKGCSVSVRGWDKNEVQYRVVQFSDPQNRMPLKINENHSESAVNIKIENPDAEAQNGNLFHGAARIRIEIYVPRKSNLKINANGEVRLEGVSGDVELAGGDESINVRDVDGVLRVSNSDGRIRVIGFRGDIDARTADGMINLEGDFQSLKAHAANGPITLTLPDDAGADLEANCSEIRGEGIAVTKISSDEDRSKYKIGKGGANFQIETEGEIRVRGANSIKTNF